MSPVSAILPENTGRLLKRLSFFLQSVPMKRIRLFLGPPKQFGDRGRDNRAQSNLNRQRFAILGCKFSKAI